MCPSASQYPDVPWLHRHSENEAYMFIGLNESISAKNVKERRKNRSFQFQTYSMKFQDSISNLT